MRTGDGLQRRALAPRETPGHRAPVATTRNTGEDAAPDAGPNAKKPGTPAPGGMRPQPLWVVVLLVVGANYLLMRTCAPESHSITIPYTVFKQQVEADNVVSVTGVGDTIQGTLKTELRYPPEATSVSDEPAPEKWFDGADRAAHVEGVQDAAAGLRRSGSRDAAREQGRRHQGA